MQKANPNSDMQTLKVHDKLYKKGYRAKRFIYELLLMSLVSREAAASTATAVGVGDEGLQRTRGFGSEIYLP